jgi:hypothetical protein
VFNAANGLLQLVSLAVLVLQVWSLIDCVTRPTQAFPAAGKLTKPAWLAITGVAAFIGLVFGAISFFGLAAIVASVVYLVDVRPAVREVQNGGNRW